MRNDVEAIARTLSKAQREALVKVAAYLDVCAGEGIGVQSPEYAKTENETLWADEVALELCDAFGLAWDHPLPAEVRAILEQENRDD